MERTSVSPIFGDIDTELNVTIDVDNKQIGANIITSTQPLEVSLGNFYTKTIYKEISIYDNSIGEVVPTFSESDISYMLEVKEL